MSQGNPDSSQLRTAEGDDMRRVIWSVGLLIGLYLIVRAIAEPFVIDVNDPATYRNDWGGPSLVGVLAVHCGPGVVAAALISAAIVRRVRSSRASPR